MAKRPALNALKHAHKITQATEPPPAQPGAAVAAADVGLQATGRTVATGIGLKQSELDALKDIAAATGLAVNALGRFAIREFIKAYRRGEIDLTGRTEEPPPPHKRLRM